MYKTKVKLYLLLVFSYLLLTSCAYFTPHGRAYKKAQSHYKKGHYELAVYESIKALKIRPNYIEVELILDEALPKAIQKHHNKIDRYKYNQKKFYWDKVLDELFILQDFKTNIEELDHPKSLIWLTKSDVRDYRTEINTAKNNAAEDHYQSGIEFKSKKDRVSQKNAAIQFQITQSFIDDYKNSQEFYMICRSEATTRIAILPFLNKSGKKRYGEIGENISSSIRSAILNDNKIMEFINIIDRQKIDEIVEEQRFSQSGLVDSKTRLEIGKLLGVHQIISGEVTFLSASNPKHIKDTQHLSKEVILKSETYVDDDGKEKKRHTYGKVKANVTTHTISASAEISLSFQIIDAETAQVLNSESVNGKHEFSHTWATFNGDQRALSKNLKKLIRKSEKISPNKDQLIFEAIKDLNKKIIRKIKKIYK